MAAMDDMIKLTGLFENTSKAGNKYFVGVLGGAKLVMLENKRRENDNDPHWTLFITERAERKQTGQGKRQTPQQRADDAQRPVAATDPPPAGTTTADVPFNDPLPL